MNFEFFLFFIIMIKVWSFFRILGRNYIIRISYKIFRENNDCFNMRYNVKLGYLVGKFCEIR